MRRRALLATVATASTVSIAGCPMPPWGERPGRVDSAEVTFRREHTGEFDPRESDTLDAVELRRDLDREPSRLLIRGRAMGGDRDCYQISLVEATHSAERLSIAVAVESSGLFPQTCGDIAESHPYEVAVAFTTASVPERVDVRHGDETVLDEAVFDEAV